MTVSNPAGSFVWYELMSPDPDASARFYEPVVGWKVASRAEPGAAMDYRMIERNDGANAGGLMRLTDEMLRGGARPCWLGYLSVGDVDAAVAAIEGDGGKALMPAFDIEVGRIAMLADPQGAPFYVMKPKPPAGREGMDSDVFSTDRPQHVRWNELRTSDPEAALAFYGKHFGIEPSGEMDMGEMGRYRFLSKAGTMIGAVMQRPKEMPASAWGFYLGVDDIDRAGDAVRSGGGQILAGPHEIPGGEFSLDGIDPQGAPFGLVGPRRAPQ
jgi:predicted enzyme related to lactoylglutathione lyase